MAVSILIAFVVIFASIWLTVVSSRRMDGLTRLPMQFGLNGEPTWYASRRVALAVCPIITAALNFFVLGGGWVVQLATAVICLGIQTFYLALLTRWASRISD